MKILVLLFCVSIGLLFVIKTEATVRTFGRFAWAERNLGAAGTYTFYKLLGVALIFIGLMYATGMIDAIVGAFLGGVLGLEQGQ